MRFLRRNQYLLSFVVVLLFSGVLVIKQVLANQSSHIQMREAFIHVNSNHQTPAADRLYQELILELPGLSEQTLADDLERMNTIVDAKNPQPDNLAWKYYVSVKNELDKRSERLVAKELRRARGN